MQANQLMKRKFLEADNKMKCAICEPRHYPSIFLETDT